MSKKTFSVGIVFFMMGCAHPPLAPSVPVMPGPGKPFDLFVQEEDDCRNFARNRVGVSPGDQANTDMVTDAAVGTVVGAAAGTAIGGITGHPGTGAIVGAGAGLIEGTAIGANSGYMDSWSLQRRYDVAYEQCMYARGNQIPGVPNRVAPPPPPPPAPPPPPYR